MWNFQGMSPRNRNSCFGPVSPGAVTSLNTRAWGVGGELLLSRSASGAIEPDIGSDAVSEFTAMHCQRNITYVSRGTQVSDQVALDGGFPSPGHSAISSR